MSVFETKPVDVVLEQTGGPDGESRSGLKRRLGPFDLMGFGLGLVIGVALGLVSVPLPGGSFSLGPAAGPLIVGMMLGALRRTGPIVWALPGSANLTLRQLGLLLFLAGLGLTAGPDVAAVLASPTAWRAARSAAGSVMRAPPTVAT